MNEVHMVFPPYSNEFLFPEIGVPRLSGYLNANGVKCSPVDLNILFPEFLAGSGNTRETIGKAVNKLSEGKKEKVEHLLNCVEDPEEFRCRIGKSLFFRSKIMGLLERGLQYIRNPLTISSAREALDKGDALLEKFYRKCFLDGRNVKEALVGFSILSPAQAIPALILAKMLKRESEEIKVVWGGPWCTEGEEVMPRFLKEFSEVDFVVIQGGEKPLLSLANALKCGDDYSGIPNLIYRNAGAIARNPIEVGERLNNIPAPEYHLLPIDKYPLKILAIQTVNQCYWGKCVMCHHYIKKADIDERDPSIVVDYMEQCRSLTGINRFIFGDCATPVSALEVISRELLDRKIDMHWAIMARAEKEFTPDFCKVMRRAGCRGMRVGLETASRRGLKFINKGITIEDIDSLIDSCNMSGIALQLFIMDYPGCLVEEVLDTLHFLEKRKGLITDFSFQHFQLSRTSAIFKNPSKYRIELPDDIDNNLDFYNMPYIDTRKKDDLAVNAALKASKDAWPRRGNPMATSWERCLGME